MTALTSVRVLFLMACFISTYGGETYKINLLKPGKRKHGEKVSMIITLAKNYDLPQHDQLHQKKKKLKQGLKKHKHKDNHQLSSSDYRTKS